MKTRLLLFASLLSLHSVLGQPSQPPAPVLPPRATPTFTGRLNQLAPQAAGAPEPVLTRFSLDFPGGTPKQLVAAIEKTMNRPLNVIIADEHTNVKLPPLKMTDVTVPQLFFALQKNSFKYDANHNVISSYGFETEAGTPTEDSIWRFYLYNAQTASPLTRFDLNFPGGTPKQLVAAIEKATGKPLNVVIPAENAEVILPPLKMNDVNVSVLFQALASASRRSVAVTTGFSGSYQQTSIGYGFKSEGSITDASIWYFYEDRPGLPTVVSVGKVCRFYSLAPYLERGTSVDDITTAIQTGWKMLGEKETPAINFHKDTKLLIAVGEPSKLETIDAVLKALQPALRMGNPGTLAPAAKPEKKPKSDPEN